MRRRSTIALLLALGSLLALARLRRDARRDRITLVYDDGSSLTFESGLPDADRLLALARPALSRA